MVSVLASGSSGPGSSPGWVHCVVFLGKTLYFHGASLYPVYRESLHANEPRDKCRPHRQTLPTFCNY